MLWTRWPSAGSLKSFREHALLCGLSLLSSEFYFVLSFASNIAHSSSQSMVQKPEEVAGKARLGRDFQRHCSLVSTADSVISDSSHTGKKQGERNVENLLSPSPSSAHKHLTHSRALPRFPVEHTLVEAVAPGRGPRPWGGVCQSHSLVFLAKPFHQAKALTATRTKEV